MYTEFFGLKELPFSIAPDPAFLYLSDRHREALAHLTFGLGETGGFVLLTGEVGTGKTTVCRCLLAQLPEHTRTAFILNPSLDEQELLATICDELGVSYDAERATRKTLFDGIRDQLLAHHQAGENTVLIIDEAQHLQPSVLEQLRLLTNLETDKSKLLKVILIGQPELQTLLRQQQLRQLAQRITARYHLQPLSQDEVAQYVQHRLRIAGCQRPLFAPRALKRLHQLSGGIPRLINLLCDRALLAAYGQGQWQVDTAMLNAAAHEVNGEAPTGRSSSRYWPMATGLLLVLVLVLGGWSGWAWHAAAEPPVPQAPKDITAQVLKELQPHLRKNQRLTAAFADMDQLWGLPAAVENCQQAAEYGLQCLWLNEELSLVQALRHPALVKLKTANQRFFATLVGMNDEQVFLHLDGQQLTVDRDWFNAYWQQQAVVLWQPPNVDPHRLRPGQRGPAVQWLTNQLALVSGREPEPHQRYDASLVAQVKQFQATSGLTADGIAGERTLIRLQAELGEVSYPWQQERP